MKWNVVKRDARGFTLIELLIVVAIIAVLAAIAVPNFLEAQVRSKVARSKADMRTQSLALEAYFVDWNSYTKDSDSSLDQLDNVPWADRANGVLQLTTPIAYMTTMLSDPFGGVIAVEGGGAQGYRIASGSWSYRDDSLNASDNQQSGAVFKAVGPRHTFAVIGVGPDRARARMAYKCFPFMSNYEGGASVEQRSGKTDGQPRMWCTYDPSNGSTSVGDIYHFGGDYMNGRYMLDGKVIGMGSSPGSGIW